MSDFRLSAYLHVRTLKNGHSDTVNYLAFSPNGAYLASGGEDHAVIIWNAQQGDLLFRLVFKSAVDVVIWHPVHPDTIILDFYVGNLVLPSPGDPVQVSEFVEQRERAVAVHFHKDGAALIVSYMAHGIIGGTALSPDHRRIVVYNLIDGLDVYALPPQKKAKVKMSFKLDAKPRQRHKMQVTYVNRGHGVVCGTTTGKISIWETHTGEVAQHLPHDEDVVQAICATIVDSTSWIATAPACRGQETYIKIWRAKIAHEDNEDRKESVIDLVHAVARSNRFKRSWKFILELLYIALCTTGCAIVGWVCYQVPWSVVWEALAAGCGQAYVSSKEYVALCGSWLYVGGVQVADLACFIASALEEWLRHILRKFLLHLIPELGENIRHGAADVPNGDL
ncbi:hypothetical protein TRAPUB_13856 [Trametes pubescens]|uniref:Uncharacterized protein n=1 Tax=Trametes pubescens TaxID=154538 RepID=A0A1M2VQ22_TRAPU|nr:hypothetical protein TRAPUB_13856 [Trametes pubescens]